MPVSLNNLTLECGESIRIYLGNSEKNYVDVFMGSDGKAAMATQMDRWSQHFLLADGSTKAITFERWKEFRTTLR